MAVARPTYANTVVQAPAQYQQEPITGQTTTLAAAQAPSVVYQYATQPVSGAPVAQQYIAAAGVPYAAPAAEYAAYGGTATQYTAQPAMAMAAPAATPFTLQQQPPAAAYGGVPGMQAAMPEGAFPFSQLPGLEHLSALHQQQQLQHLAPHPSG